MPLRLNMKSFTFITTLPFGNYVRDVLIHVFCDIFHKCVPYVVYLVGMGIYVFLQLQALFLFL